jgi:hypothetical protein
VECGECWVLDWDDVGAGQERLKEVEGVFRLGAGAVFCFSKRVSVVACAQKIKEDSLMSSCSYWRRTLAPTVVNSHSYTHDFAYIHT